MNEYHTHIDEVATTIAQAYSSFGNLSSLYLGQTSTQLFLSLFTPIHDEVSSFWAFLIGEGQSSYAESDDPSSLFIERCRTIVEAEPLWATLQGRRKPTIPKGIADPGYGAIIEAIRILQKYANQRETLAPSTSPSE